MGFLMSLYSPSDLRLLALARMISEPVAVFSRQGVIVYANPSLCQSLGYSLAELEGLHVRALSAEPQSSKQALEQQKDHILLRLLHHKNGTLIKVEMRVDYPHDPADTLLFLTLRCLEQEKKPLQDDELRWRAAMDSSGDGIWDWDLRSGAKYHSAKWCQMLGYDEHGITTDKDFWISHLHPDDREHTLKALADCLNQRSEHYAAEFRMFTATGAWKWISARGRVVEWQDNQPLRVLGTHRDIDPLRQVESAYLESRATFAAWLEQSPDAIAITTCTQDAIYLYVNAAYCYMVGALRDELIGTSALTHDLWSNPLQARATYELLASGIPIVDLPCLFRSKDGIEIPTSISGQRIQVEGEYRLMISRRDVSERVFAEQRLRESEARWRFAIEGHGDALWDWNVDAGTIYRSPRWLELLMLPMHRATVAIDEHSTVFFDDDFSDLKNDLRQLLAGNVDELKGECRLCRSDGELIWVGYRCRVMERNARGKPKRVIGTMNDITQARLHYQALETQLDRISHSGRLLALGEMATTIAHEINQPLAVITSYSGVMARKTADFPELNLIAQRVEEQALRAGQIVWRMRQFGRHQNMALSAVDVKNLIEESLDWIKLDTGSFGVELSTRYPVFTPAIWADRIQIQQVLLNLLRNAVQSMHDNSGKRVVQVRVRHDEPRREVVIEVADRGCGLPSQVAFDVFKPFFTTKTDGLGLGLSISQSILARHNGRLWSKEREGGGTIFSFSIPQPPEGDGPVQGHVLGQEKIS